MRAGRQRAINKKECRVNGVLKCALVKQGAASPRQNCAKSLVNLAVKH